MADCGGRAERPAGTSAGSAIFQDAQTLKATMCDAVSTSPNSFLITLRDVASKEAGDWIYEIKSSTWVVAERDGEGVGVAACKPPQQGQDEESDQDSRYIESVWIHPGLRGRRLGERLIRYLMAAEFRKNPDIRQFLLWVFEENESAINLYQRMDFVSTGEKHDGSRPEIKYRLDVNPEAYPYSWQAAAEALLSDGKGKYRVTYRVLGEGDSV
jgi:ribosomal protein S18 acetylase RimI-like enzyme